MGRYSLDNNSRICLRSGSGGGLGELNGLGGGLKRWRGMKLAKVAGKIKMRIREIIIAMLSL